MNKKESKIITKIQKIKKAFDLYNKCMKNQNDPLLICINELSKNEIKNIFPFINTKHKKNNILKQIKDQIKSSKKNINNHIILIIDNFLKKHITRRRQVALQILYLIFQNKVEQTLIQPTFVTGFSNLSNPLAKKNNNDRALIDRFELFCSGIEIANSFSELNNPIEQKKRFLKQINDNKNEISINKNYINALKIGMPPTAGEGIGIDRLIMILTNSKSIKDVILFPTMK
jgi:lysyl-tRNA synthetase class II